MAIGLVGQKCGMTRVFTETGEAIPVTVIQVTDNRVTQIKREETDGYVAVQVTAGHKKPSRVNKPAAGHFAKASVEPGIGLWEFLLDSEEELQQYELGKEISVDIFAEGQMVDVVSTSRGKGFAGVIKRHNFSAQRASHGNSLSHRAPGSIGQNQSPGRVFKGKKMAGHMGNKRCTIQNQKIVQVDKERNLLLVKGAVPGAPGCNVVINFAVKAAKVAQENN
jgi:large subunit ribosomal protein L3